MLQHLEVLQSLLWKLRDFWTQRTLSRLISFHNWKFECWIDMIFLLWWKPFRIGTCDPRFPRTWSQHMLRFLRQQTCNLPCMHPVASTVVSMCYCNILLACQMGFFHSRDQQIRHGHQRFDLHLDRLSMLRYQLIFGQYRIFGRYT